MIHKFCVTPFVFAVVLACNGAAISQTTLSSLTANNTSACPASGTLPAQCSTTYAGQIDTRQYVTTPEFDRPAGNVSDEDIHGYLNHGSSTRIYANFMLAYCIQSGGYCNNNVETGYTADNANTVAAQAEDLRRRHIDGAVMTWEGDGTSEDSATLLFQSYVNKNHCSGAQNCDPMYLIMYDGPSWSYNVTSTGIAGTSGAACNGTLNNTNNTAADFENCVIQHIRNDMCYMNGYHWGNDAYQKVDGRPLVQVFPDETVIPATGAAPSWADVWVQIGAWNNNLESNCAKAPYDANNGVPEIIFEGDSGFTHTDTSGSYYWIQPSSSTNVQTAQTVYNISPASTGGTLDNFLQTAVSFPSLWSWTNGFKGFNSSQAKWGTGRIMDQECGQIWMQSLTESNKYYSSSAVPYLQIATWNDYNEGTEIESGIDNCYTVGASVNGQTLNWTLNPTNSALAKWQSTVSHVEIYDTTDGVNVTLLSSPAAAASGTYSLSGLAHGNHTLYVRMVGKNSILNRLSSGVAYSN